MGVKVINIFLDGRLSGPVRRIIEVARRLSDKGFTTIIVLPDISDDVASLLKLYHLKYYINPSLKRFRNSRNPLYLIQWMISFLPAFFWLKKIFKKENVSIIHCNGLTQIIGPLAGKAMGVKVVWHLNDVAAPKMILQLFRPIINRFSDCLLFASDAVRNHFGTLSKKIKWQIVYAPVDTAFFEPEESNRTSIKKSLSIADSVPVVGMIGNINKLKGIVDFVQAAAYVHKIYPNTKFIHIGARLETKIELYNSIRKSIKKLGLQDSFYMLGKQTDVKPYLQAMDVYVIPSLSEACPISLLEAMSMARPVVATNVGGIPELIIDGKEGYLVPPRQPRLIADKVIHYLEHPALRWELGQNARQKAIQFFDIRQCVQKHAAIYNELAK